MGIEASVCPRWPPGGPPPAGSLTGALGAELVGHVQQRQQGHQAVVTIGLNEVMTCNGCRVNVMLPEWSDESLGWGREAGVGIHLTHQPLVLSYSPQSLAHTRFELTSLPLGCQNIPPCH